jgi:CRP-like cAMP-binding protein
MQLSSKHHEIIRSNPLFTDLDEADFTKIVGHITFHEFEAGEMLFRQKQPARYFFLVITGKIKISLLSFEGTEKVIDMINQGNTFAEAVIFQGMQGYPVNAEALLNSSVLRIDADAYKNILRHSPEACFKALAALTRRVHWLMNELDRLTLHNATYRLISFLLEDIPVDIVEQTEINLTAPKHVIASRISVTPETFSRTLKTLSKQGVLSVHDRHVVLNNPGELRKMLSL